MAERNQRTKIDSEKLLKAVPSWSEQEEAEQIDLLFKEATTFADFFKRYYRKKLNRFIELLPRGEEFWMQFSRQLDPWPEWVLRIAVEVCSVQVPTIKKEVVYDSLRFLHAIFFELRLDGSTPKELLVVPKLDAQVLGAALGHMSVLTQKFRVEADSALAKGALTKEQHASFAKFSDEGFQAAMKPYLTRYMDAEPAGWKSLFESMVDAQRKTLDKTGCLKETTTTQIYRAILTNWTDVECLSGPTELCKFLEPMLGGSGNDPEKKLDRVKKICRRMGIKFTKRVKGQGYRPTLSLPESVEGV